MGALVMSHSDDHGLVLPPRLAPIQLVVVPIYKSEEQLLRIDERVQELIKPLREMGVTVKYDNRTTHKPGWKFAEYELKGVPLRLGLGPRDLENGTAELARRDTLEKQVIAQDDLVTKVKELLYEIQENLFKKAISYRDSMITEVDTFDEFKEVLETKGGFVSAHWDGTGETEEEIKTRTKATIRCIPLNAAEEEGKCVLTGRPSSRRVIFAKAY
jgi:prolyl-tRNA synthetase